MSDPRVRLVRMPKWGLAMQEGTLRAWCVAEGACIAAGAPLCEIETAKIANEFEAPAAGVVARLQAAPGEVLPVGRVIAVLCDADTPAEAIDGALADEGEAAAPEGDPSAASGRHWVATAAGELAYLEAGDSERSDPVLLLHGWGGDLGSWTLVQPALAATHRTIAFDLPGHGRSTKAVGTGTAEALAATLDEALSALGIERFHLVAHSFGATVAGALAKRGGRAIGKVCLLAPLGFGSAASAAYIEGFLSAQRKRDMRPALEMLFASPSFVGRAMVADALHALRDDAARAALRQIAVGLTAPEPGIARVPAWAEGLKLCVIWGAEDCIVPLPTGLEAQLGSRLVVMPGCGHLPQIEAADRIASLLRDHLAA